MDKRFELMSEWVAQVLKETGLRIEPASGDASFRRYFRVYVNGATFIIMDAPPDKENSEPFTRISSWLLAMGLNVPQVLHQQPENGFYLLTDLGSQLYLSQLNNDTAGELYEDAINALVVMQVGGADYEALLPAYDSPLLLKEMQLFTDWYLGRHLAIELDSQQQTVIQNTFNELINNALDQPRVLVHRDYHSRNLMLQENREKNPGILDFQDAVYGPVTYDLVSLLRDCYISWSDERIGQWLNNHYSLLCQHGLLHDVSLSQYQQWFDLMGVQRHLKATGIFARLHYRDEKSGYMQDIPRTMGYILQLENRYPQLESFIRLLNELSVPDRMQAEVIS